MLLKANFANTKREKSQKITETLAYGYSSESTQRELSNEYQHDRVLMVFKNLCIIVIWTKVASALEGLKQECDYQSIPVDVFDNHCQDQKCIP